MNLQRNRTAVAGMIALALTMSLAVSGCRKKVGTVPPPKTTEVAKTPDAPQPAPRINSFTVEPSRIDRGQNATLRWSAANATEVTIDQGIGAVPANGTRTVSPNSTTTYTLTAKGPGGTDTRTATLTVSEPAPPPPPPKPTEVRQTIDEFFSQNLKDIYFDFDRNDIRPDARATLTANAEALRRADQLFGNPTVLIEGHCDERGSAEYNLGLGDRRATATKEFLVQLGISGDRLKTVSYGKERPQCTEATEDCYQRNRRAHFVPGR